MSGLLAGKTVVVTGCASGVGLETARVCKAWGATVLGVDRTMTHEHVDTLYKADLSDPQTIEALVQRLPAGVHGIAHLASLPPTAPAVSLFQVNWLGRRAFTLGMAPTLADGAGIVHMTSPAGGGWPDQVSTILESERLGADDVDAFVRAQGLDTAAGRVHDFCAQALVAWTLRNAWAWRDRGIRMNVVGAGPSDARDADDGAATDPHGAAADLAPVIAFLLSDASRGIRGTLLPVDGGLSSHRLCTLHGLA